MLITILIGVFILSSFIFAVFFFIVLPFLFGASFERSTKNIMENIMTLSNAKQNEKMADLGSGDGSIVIEFAKRGVEAHGFEINPFLVLWSKLRIKKNKLQDKAFIHWKNFWISDLKDFDIVIIFQVGYLMGALERKLEKELKKGARVISNRWKFPLWKIKKKIDIDTGIYLYEV